MDSFLHHAVAPFLAANRIVILSKLFVRFLYSFSLAHFGLFAYIITWFSTHYIRVLTREKQFKGGSHYELEAAV